MDKPARISDRDLGFNTRFLFLQNCIGVILSVAVLATGFWLADKNKTDCATFLQRPIIAIGVLLLVVSLAGVIAACGRWEWLVWFHLISLFLLVILLFCFSIFALEITNTGTGHEVPGKHYKEYRLSDYPKWMRHRVENRNYWNRVVKCLQKSRVCNLLPAYGTGLEYDPSQFSPVQVGCCIPPSACNFTYLGVSKQWVKPTIRDRDDCKSWSNLPYRLCYYCDSCKAGEIQASMDHWRKAGFLGVVLVMIMIVMYALFACYAFQSERK